MFNDNMAAAQRKYDRELPGDRVSRPDESEYEARELTEAESNNALRCGSHEEAKELRKQNPGRIVIIVGKPLFFNI